MRWIVFLDEGGVRVERGEGPKYLPYGAIDDVAIESSFIGHSSVVITVAGQSRRVHVGPNALELHRALVEHLATRAARSTQPIEAGYRDDARPLSAELRVFEDADADPSPRAEAARAILEAGDEADLVRIAKVVATRALPPVVYAAIRLAGGEAFVPDVLLDSIVPFLDPGVDAALRAHLPASVPHPSHLAAMARAQREIAADSTSVAAAQEQHATRRRAAAGSNRDASRWIGKSWGL